MNFLESEVCELEIMQARIEEYLLNIKKGKDYSVAIVFALDNLHPSHSQVLFHLIYNKVVDVLGAKHIKGYQLLCLKKQPEELDSFGLRVEIEEEVKHVAQSIANA